jgi:hypothetical protein
MMNVRRVLVAMVLAGAASAQAATAPSVVVVGIDGMDPVFTKFMAEGRMRTFRASHGKDPSTV